jgi:hypothetical protein
MSDGAMSAADRIELFMGAALAAGGGDSTARFSLTSAHGDLATFDAAPLLDDLADLLVALDEADAVSKEDDDE